MRIPVFARGANPRVDRFLQKKSLSYCLDEVLHGRADWIDPNEMRKGIICRQRLYIGQTGVIAAVVAQTVNPQSYDWQEIPGVRWRRPPMPDNPHIAKIRFYTSREIHQNLACA